MILTLVTNEYCIFLELRNVNNVQILSSWYHSCWNNIFIMEEMTHFLDYKDQIFRCFKDKDIPEPSISSNSSLWNQLAPEFILIKSSFNLFCWYGCLTDTHTIGYSISGVITILKTFRGDGRTQSKCFKSINLFNGSYHCIRNIPAGIAPHRYLYLC